jgi:hypothetical protein
LIAISRSVQRRTTIGNAKTKSGIRTVQVAPTASHLSLVRDLSDVAGS